MCKNILHDTGEADHNPTQRTVETFAKLEVCLDHHKRHSAPEDNLQSVQNEVCLETSPLLECAGVAG